MKIKAYIFDWGDTLMEDIPSYQGKMKDWPKVKEIHHALDTIKTLKKDYKIYLATNAKDSNKDDILKALKRVGLNEYIDNIYSFKNIGFKKDNPLFFKKIIEDTGFKNNELIMVGDSFEKDILSANKKGIFGIWLNNKNTEVKKGKLHDTIFSLEDISNFKKKE